MCDCAYRAQVRAKHVLQSTKDYPTYKLPLDKPSHPTDDAVRAQATDPAYGRSLSGSRGS